MQFKSLVLAAVLSWSHVQALTAKDVTNSLSNITTLSADTLDLVKGLNTENVEADGLVRPPIYSAAQPCTSASIS